MTPSPLVCLSVVLRSKVAPLRCLLSYTVAKVGNKSGISKDLPKNLRKLYVNHRSDLAALKSNETPPVRQNKY